MDIEQLLAKANAAVPAAGADDERYQVFATLMQKQFTAKQALTWMVRQKAVLPTDEAMLYTRWRTRYYRQVKPQSWQETR